MKIKPLFDRVLILPTPEKETLSGLALPNTSAEKPFLGTVVAVGNGLDTEGKKQELQVVVGQKVLYSKYGGTPIIIDKNQFISYL